LAHGGHNDLSQISQWLAHSPQTISPQSVQTREHWSHVALSQWLQQYTLSSSIT
jgi:hypothetical protein